MVSMRLICTTLVQSMLFPLFQTCIYDKNTIYPGLQLSNGIGLSVWNESVLCPQWAVYQQNTQHFSEKWSNNLTATNLGHNPPWIIMGWIDSPGRYIKDYYIQLASIYNYDYNYTRNDTQMYSLIINFTILVGCTWDQNSDNNIQVCIRTGDPL